jgi:allophanate hydrolase subunit 1
VIRRHSQREYQVFALGFAPGFAFMGLVDERLASAAPGHPAQARGGWQRGHRRTADRRLPGGIAGGWNLIGRTPVRCSTVSATATA